MSKEERAALAIAKRTQEIREQKLKQENARMDREALEREAEELQLRNNQSNRYGGGSTRRQSINLPSCARRSQSVTHIFSLFYYR
jgi:ATP-dependent RNA helicase DDX23/PRP28